MGFLRQLAGAVANGAQTGLRIVQVENVLRDDYGHTLTRPHGQQRLDELINFLPDETPIRDIAVCFLAVQAREHFLTGARARETLATVIGDYKSGRVSEQMVRELCAAIGKQMSKGLY